MRPFIRVAGKIAGIFRQRARQLSTSGSASWLPYRLRDPAERSVDLALLKIVINISRR